MADTTKQLLDILTDLDLVRTINSAPNFHDEPIFFNYACRLKNIKLGNKNIMIGGNGFSLFSKKEAVLKCLAETIERYCLYTEHSVSKSQIGNSHYFPLPKDLKHSIKDWTEGLELTGNISAYIPTQLVYIGHVGNNEKEIMESNSTGAAFGFNKNETILRGIYEVIERDAFMSYYLTKTSPKKIKLSSIKNNIFQETVFYIKRYDLEIALFDITTDLKIPSFLTCLIDKSHHSGPSLVLGIKSSLNIYDAILGSLSEALQLRPWLRYRNITSKNTLPKREITTIQDRANYWYGTDKLHLLNFLFDQKTTSLVSSTKKYRKTQELSSIIEILKQKNIRVYAIDVLNSIFPEDMFVYKVLIPQLQPLYLTESKRFIHYDRLKDFSTFHHNHTFSINPIPHPFL